MMNAMMQETLLSGTARKAEIPGWPAAGKTGTSQDFRDAWFIGYTANLVTGVWLGNDDNSPTRKATGGGLPVEVWTRFMRTAHQGVAVAALPGGGGFFSNFTTAQSGPAHQASAAAVRPHRLGTAVIAAPGRRSRHRRLADGQAVRAKVSCLGARPRDSGTQYSARAVATIRVTAAAAILACRLLRKARDATAALSNGYEA